jgi:lysophospholipase L1-like esterase
VQTLIEGERMRQSSLTVATLAILVAALMVPSFLLAVQGPPAPAISAPSTPGVPAVARGGPLPPATEPRPRDDARHQSFLEIARKGNIDLLFVGDSITDWWAQRARGQSVWNATFASMNPANFGIAGDTTQGVLWRMQNGELDGFKAKLIVFMLGTNNINRNSNEDIAAGDRAIIEEFRKRQPQAKILLLGIFPRNADPANPLRASIKEINASLQKLADGRQVFYKDIGEKFLMPDGALTIEIMADGLHPTTKGYQIWADAIIDDVKRLMQ